MSNTAKTCSPAEAQGRLLRWCVYAGEHFQEEGWLMVFCFANGLQATVAFGPFTNGLSVGVMKGDALVAVWDWLDGGEVLERLIDVMERNVPDE